MTTAPWQRNQTHIPPSRAPRRSEASLQRECCQWLAVLEAQGRLRFCAIPNGAVLRGDREERARHMASLKRQGLRPGAPDLVVMLPDGRTGWCELKAEGGKLTAEQIVWREALKALGHEWRLIRSLDELREFVTGLGRAPDQSAAITGGTND